MRWPITLLSFVYNTTLKKRIVWRNGKICITDTSGISKLGMVLLPILRNSPVTNELNVLSRFKYEKIVEKS